MSVLALVPVFPIIAIFDAESNVTRVTALFFVGCVYFRMHDASWGDGDTPTDGEGQPDRRGLTSMTVVAAVAFVVAAALAH